MDSYKCSVKTRKKVKINNQETNKQTKKQMQKWKSVTNTVVTNATILIIILMLMVKNTLIKRQGVKVVKEKNKTK